MEKRLFLGENFAKTIAIDHDKVKRMVQLSIATDEESKKIIELSKIKKPNLDLISSHSRLIAEKSTLYLSATAEEKSLVQKMLEETTD